MSLRSSLLPFVTDMLPHPEHLARYLEMAHFSGPDSCDLTIRVISLGYEEKMGRSDKVCRADLGRWADSRPRVPFQMALGLGTIHLTAELDWWLHPHSCSSFEGFFASCRPGLRIVSSLEAC